MSYNRCIFLGNMTRDVELKTLPGGTVVAEGGMATNRKWKAKDGSEREEVCFVDWIAFGHTANSIHKWTSKGTAVLMEGRLCLDRWETHDGQKRSKHKITVDSYRLVGNKQEQAPPQADEDVPF